MTDLARQLQGLRLIGYDHRVYGPNYSLGIFRRPGPAGWRHECRVLLIHANPPAISDRASFTSSTPSRLRDWLKTAYNVVIEITHLDFPPLRDTIQPPTTGRK